MLREQRLRAHQIRAEAVDLAHRVFIVVGGFSQERDDFGAVVTAHRGLEALLAQVHWADPHHPLGWLRCDGIVGRSRWILKHQVLTIRLPKIAVPTRTSVAPSWIATSKSWLMPIDRSPRRELSAPPSMSRSRSR